MKSDRLVSVYQATCEHLVHEIYTQRRFDILNGFEMVLTRCINCHKTLKMEIKHLG